MQAFLENPKRWLHTSHSERAVEVECLPKGSPQEHTQTGTPDCNTTRHTARNEWCLYTKVHASTRILACLCGYNFKFCIGVISLRVLHGIARVECTHQWHPDDANAVPYPTGSVLSPPRHLLTPHPIRGPLLTMPATAKPGPRDPSRHGLFSTRTGVRS